MRGQREAGSIGPFSVLTFPHEEAILAEAFKPLPGTTSKKVSGSRPGSYVLARSDRGRPKRNLIDPSSHGFWERWEMSMPPCPGSFVEFLQFRDAFFVTSCRC
jgi:hypothetical protein